MIKQKKNYLNALCSPTSLVICFFFDLLISFWDSFHGPTFFNCLIYQGHLVEYHNIACIHIPFISDFMSQNLKFSFIHTYTYSKLLRKSQLMVRLRLIKILKSLYGYYEAKIIQWTYDHKILYYTKLMTFHIFILQHFTLINRILCL